MADPNKNVFVRIFDGFGKPKVDGEKSLDGLVPDNYNPKIEESKTNNKINLERNKVWVWGGTGTFVVILLLPLISAVNVFYLSHRLSSDLSDLDKSQIARIEKLYEDARQDSNDRFKVIVPSLFTLVVASVFVSVQSKNQDGN